MIPIFLIKCIEFDENIANGLKINQFKNVLLSNSSKFNNTF